MGQQDVADVLRFDPVFIEAGREALQARRRTGLDEGRRVLAGQEIGSDDPLGAQKVQVNRLYLHPTPASPTKSSNHRAA